jgi:hypothetical protein
MAHDGAVVIAGAGPAGIATAIAAARNGCRVLLLEKQALIGGTVTSSLIHTLGGFYDDAGEYLNQGLSAQLCERLLAADPLVVKRKIGRTWCLAVDPVTFRQVVTEWIAEEPLISLATDSCVQGGTVSAPGVGRLEIMLQGSAVSLVPAAVVDATGNAALVQLLDPNLVQQNHEQVAAGFVFRLQGAAPGALAFPKGVALLRLIRQAGQDGTLSPVAASAWLDLGLREDELFVKLTVPLDVSGKPAIGLDEAMDARDRLVLFLRQQPALRQVVCVETGQISSRDGARINGKTCLTEDDILSCRSCPEAACLGAWPLEYWDQQQGVKLRYLPARGRYTIPLGSLQVAGIERLWVAGKCLSATPLAQASARVVGCCWAMGDAVGRAIAANIHTKEQR